MQLCSLYKLLSMSGMCLFHHPKNVPGFHCSVQKMELHGTQEGSRSSIVGTGQSPQDFRCCLLNQPAGYVPEQGPLA